MANNFERKKRSEEFLREHGIYVDEALPPLEAPKKIISKEDQFYRGINAFYTGLSAVVILGDANDLAQAARLVGILEQSGLSKWATEKELNFHEYIMGTAKGLSGNAEDFAALLRNRNRVSRQEVSCMSWRVERSLPLLWACGMIDKDLPYPSEASDYHYVVDCFWNLYDRLDDPSLLVKGELPLNGRSIEEIMDQADLVYRMEQACKKARREKDKTRIDTSFINDLKHRVVYEWNWGFQWLLQAVSGWDNDDIEKDGAE